MKEDTTVNETPETIEETSKLKTFAKKYWKPVAAGAAVTAAAITAVVHFRNSNDEEENSEASYEDGTSDAVTSTDSPEQ